MIRRIDGKSPRIDSVSAASAIFTVKLGEDGFVPIPDEVAAATGLHVGMGLDVEVRDGRIILRPMRGGADGERTSLR